MSSMRSSARAAPSTASAVKRVRRRLEHLWLIYQPPRPTERYANDRRGRACGAAALHERATPQSQLHLFLFWFLPSPVDTAAPQLNEQNEQRRLTALFCAAFHPHIGAFRATRFARLMQLRVLSREPPRKNLFHLCPSPHHHTTPRRVIRATKNEPPRSTKEKLACRRRGRRASPCDARAIRRTKK